MSRHVATMFAGTAYAPQTTDPRVFVDPPWVQQLAEQEARHLAIYPAIGVLVATLKTRMFFGVSDQLGALDAIVALLRWGR